MEPLGCTATAQSFRQRTETLQKVFPHGQKFRVIHIAGGGRPVQAPSVPHIFSGFAIAFIESENDGVREPDLERLVAEDPVGGQPVVTVPVRTNDRDVHQLEVDAPPIRT